MHNTPAGYNADGRMGNDFIYEYCCENMLCERCGLELDANMEDAVENKVLAEPCECMCHELV